MMRISVLIMLLASVLTACGPSNLHECQMEAAKMPTERGAIIASQACYKKFPPPAE